MVTALDTLNADGRVVISFPETALSQPEREDFIAFLKAEWIVRQSRFSDANAQSFAREVDAGWWTRNRERILRQIGVA